MDIPFAFAFLARLLTFRSRWLLVLSTHVEDWYSAETCNARTILSLSLQCVTSLPSPGGGSMIIFFWIVVGTIVASTSVALLCYKRSEMTLSEIAEKLEKQEASPAQRDPKQAPPRAKLSDDQNDALQSDKAAPKDAQQTKRQG
jgi:hypothetical protein